MTENIRKFLIKTLFMREHSILLGNQSLVVTHKLSCKSELNTKDRYVVAVCRFNGIVVGHIPKKVSFLCAVFIKRGGTIQCTVSTIYHHIFPHLALALQNCKGMLLFFRGFFVTTIDFLVLLLS